MFDKRWRPATRWSPWSRRSSVTACRIRRTSRWPCAVESIVREHGATPATIAVIDGMCTRRSSTRAEIELLATRADVHKATTRDLPWLVATGATGATTVAATMHLAALAGIRVFATGGIGGVHRGASTTFDISADLTELASTPVAVVCAGVKSILDIALTLEYLETVGVPVVVVGSDEFPAFYSRSSGQPAPRRRRRRRSRLAAVLDATWRRAAVASRHLHRQPDPGDDEIPAGEIDGVIAEALPSSMRKASPARRSPRSCCRGSSSRPAAAA